MKKDLNKVCSNGRIDDSHYDEMVIAYAGEFDGYQPYEDIKRNFLHREAAAWGDIDPDWIYLSWGEKKEYNYSF